MEEVRARGGWGGAQREGEGRRERTEKEEGREGVKAANSGGGYPLSGAPCGGMAGIQERWKGGISRRPHDLFRPGGTCASQPLMAAITLPTHWCLNPEKKDKSVGWWKINICLLLGEISPVRLMNFRQK